MASISLTCSLCQKPFIKDAAAHRYQLSIGRSEFYCGRRCANLACSKKFRAAMNREFIELKCGRCGVAFSRALSWYKGKAKLGQKNFYCSQKCSPFAQKVPG